MKSCYKVPSDDSCKQKRAEDMKAITRLIKRHRFPVLIGKIYGTQKGQDYMAKIISKRIDRSLSQALKENRAITAQVCGDVISSESSNSRLMQRCDEPHIVNLTISILYHL